MYIWRFKWFFSNFYDKFELKNVWAQVKNVQPEVTVFVGQFYQEKQIIFWWNFWYVNDEPSISKQKLRNLNEKLCSLCFWEDQKKLSQLRKSP